MEPVNKLFAKVLEISRNDPAVFESYALAYGKMQGIMRNVEYAIRFEGAGFLSAIDDELKRLEKEEFERKVLTPSKS